MDPEPISVPPPDQPLRVAMVTARTLPFMGGIETHVEEVAGRLAALGVELTVMSTDVTGTSAAHEERGGFVVRRYRAYPASKDYHFAPGLVRAILNGSFDAIHVQGAHNAVLPLSLAAAFWRRCPTVVTFHTGGNSSTLRHMARGLQWRAEGPLLRRADKLVAVCEFEVEMFSRILHIDPSEIALVRNGSDRLPRSEAPSELSGDPLILSIGRLERYKGHHRAVWAMPDVLARAPRARLGIVGRGPYEPALRALVDSLGLGEVVSFVSYGPGDRDRLGALVRSSDVTVLLSEYEAHPVSAMEALAEGVNVVVAGTSGLTELGRAGLVDVVGLGAPASVVADAILRAAHSERWSAGPPVLPSWDDCAHSLYGIYREVARCGS